MVRKIKTKNIEFITTVPPLVDIAPPVPASQMIPKWFDMLSNDIPDFQGPFPRVGDWIKEFTGHTIKKCPAVIDYLTEGYIVPLWCDLLVQKHGEKIHWENHNIDYGQIEFHNYEQAQTYPFEEGDHRHPLKFISPWFFKTPPGWSTMFIPPLLERNEHFTLIPGIVETDSFHQINFPGIWHTQGDTILKRGMPFLHVIPFKREKKPKLIVRKSTQDDMDMIRDEQTSLRSKFTGGYREITRRFRKTI